MQTCRHARSGATARVGPAGGDEVGGLQLFEKPSQTDHRCPSFSGSLTEYDGPGSPGVDLVTPLGLELELALGLGLGLHLSSLTTVTIVSSWMVMPMSGPPVLASLGVPLTGGPSLLLAHMSSALPVRLWR